MMHLKSSRGSKTSGKIPGKKLNLANWQIAMQSPSLNLANIFFYGTSIVTLVVFE